MIATLSRRTYCPVRCEDFNLTEVRTSNTVVDIETIRFSLAVVLESAGKRATFTTEVRTCHNKSPSLLKNLLKQLFPAPCRKHKVGRRPTDGDVISWRGADPARTTVPLRYTSGSVPGVPAKSFFRKARKPNTPDRMKQETQGRTVKHSI